MAVRWNKHYNQSDMEVPVFSTVRFCNSMHRVALSLLFCLLPAVSFADNGGENRMYVTLEQVIDMARTNSLDAAVALNELKSAYWAYKSFRAELLPEVTFQATAPNYNRKYSDYQSGDGSHTFVRNDYVSVDGSLSVSQSVWLTGGTLSLTSSLEFLSQTGSEKARQFMTLPVVMTFTQPLFGVNTVKWDRRIEPVRYREAKARFLSKTEEVTMTAVNMFFNLLLANENVGIARQNLQNAEKLYEVAKAKRGMGQISENDMLQLELNVLNATSELTSNESKLKSSMFALRSFLLLDGDVELSPVLPDTVPQMELDYAEVLSKAMENNAFASNVRRRQLEADYEVARARGDRRQVTLFAQLGFTGTSPDIGNAYRDLQDNSVVEVGINIPILDWGKRKGMVKVAESNRETVRSRLKQEEIDFRQDIFILTENFNNQSRQLDISARADRIARKCYDSNVETFMIGRISTLDLDNARVNKDEARQKFINELFYYWYYYYQIRSLTLWDFAGNCNIDADFERLVLQ